jgi:sugar/nucleoside kinase (ribokinase family)
MNPHEFVAIGDTVVDAFIRLVDPSAHIDIDHDQKELSMKFGDKVPYQEKYVLPAVGNAANAAVAAARLGMTSAIVASVGGDRQGEDVIAEFKKNNVGTDFIAIHKELPTNYHYVLWYQEERTILIKHEQYPYIIPEEMAVPKWIYLSSLGEHGKDFHQVLATYLQAHPEVKLAFQPGTFQMKMGIEAMRGVYEHTEIFFCNREEAARILGTATTDLHALLDGIRALGPKIVVITDGPDGAYAANADGAWFVPAYPDPKPPYERTGAGDAFSSTVTGALALGLPLEKALLWGPINSMSVVQKVGAQEGLLDRASIENLLSTAPSMYTLRPLA